ncbi:hypothetical protein ACH5RR_004409 [Cinchona calisaya]|uniref:Uncharacterized protein n=1 Tax=Cinchona calisaya TaxID=153742 RepID=A0ABD3AXV7_9GENT
MIIKFSGYPHLRLTKFLNLTKLTTLLPHNLSNEASFEIFNALIDPNILLDDSDTLPSEVEKSLLKALKDTIGNIEDVSINKFFDEAIVVELAQHAVDLSSASDLHQQVI